MSQSQRKTRRALLCLLQEGLATLACLPHYSRVQPTAAGERAAENETDHLQPPLQLIASADYKGPIFHTYSQMRSGKKLQPHGAGQKKLLKGKTLFYTLNPPQNRVSYIFLRHAAISNLRRYPAPICFPSPVPW